jgi:RHS repeat-associated protein
MGISDGQGAQPYKYTGKELDMEHGLMQYDFEARQYDPTVGRFMTMDPLAEKYYNISPYAYCLNNPVRYTDENGMEPGDENDPIELPEIVVTPKPTIQPGNQVLPAQSWWWNIWYFLAGTRHWTPSHPTLGRYGRQPVYEIWADGKVGQEKPPYTELTFTAPISTTPVSALRGIKDLSKFIKSIKDLRTLKSLVKDLSKPGSKLTQQELDELRTLVKQHGGQVRVDLTGIKGTGTTPHAHVEGLGSSLESRHIWLETGVK